MSQLLIDGHWVDGVSIDRLTDKYNGAVFGEMAVAYAIREMTEERLITIAY
jgi:hypothetical protein